MQKAYLITFLLISIWSIAQNDSLTIRFDHDSKMKRYRAKVQKLELKGLIYYDLIGETYYSAKVLTGWSNVPSGKSYTRPWDNIYPFDNHPYEIHSSYRELAYHQKPSFDYYKVKDGKLYNGRFTDSLETLSGIKDIYCSGSVIDGRLHGEVIFYFSSADHKRDPKIQSGQVKTVGQYNHGKPMGKWTYYGYFGHSSSPVYSKLEERHYTVDRQFVTKGQHFGYSDSQYVATQYEYKSDNLLQYVKHFMPNGQLQRVEQMVEFEQVNTEKKGGVDIPSYSIVFDVTAYQQNPGYKDVIQAKGQKKTGPRFSYDIGYWEYFYDNGQLYMKGSYNNGNEVGLWYYYYETGQLKWVHDHSNNSILLEYYEPDGQQTVINGEGYIIQGTSKQIIKGGTMVETISNYEQKE